MRRSKDEVCQINGYDCFNSVVDLPSCNSWIFRIAVKHQVVKVISEEVQSLQGQIWASVWVAGRLAVFVQLAQMLLAMILWSCPVLLMGARVTRMCSCQVPNKKHSRAVHPFLHQVGVMHRHAAECVDRYRGANFICLFLSCPQRVTLETNQRP